MLGRYQSNLGMEHWKAAKKFLRYLQGTKCHMLTYNRSNHLEVIGYSNSDFHYKKNQDYLRKNP
uniref:Retrovirus-related Pol polyprotein from transposon TNT 1-94 n=1 Tax=Cajanus cajan TaxID=3821 RepID=A0A151T337_CAJCA|nr:hypothetical protein KK1_015927 [Cajanus cajan]